MRRTVARRVIACTWRALLLAVAFGTALGVVARPAVAADPITIGFAEALTGNLAVVGKTGLLAEQIWAEDINAKGGLLGRQVKLIYYDNQSNPANVPGIYTKLLDVDHVDLVVSPYATNMAAPAMPVGVSPSSLPRSSRWRARPPRRPTRFRPTLWACRALPRNRWPPSRKSAGSLGRYRASLRRSRAQSRNKARPLRKLPAACRMLPRGRARPP